MAVDTSRRQATIAGIPMKHISLVTLTFQNSALILIMHYSRIMPPVNGQRYFTSTAVFLNEVIKLAVCLTAALYEIASSPHTHSTTATGLFKELSRAVFTGDSWKLAIPAMLYTLQNTLQYTAVSNLDAATFQVTYQLKILTTALFSVTLLGRSLSARKWLSLVLLMAGVAIVQIPAGTPVVPKAPSTSSNEPSKRSATYEGIDGVPVTPELNASVGLVAVMLACMISGLAGVYFEKILKDNRGDGRSTSVWVRNVQLSFYSLWPALFVGVLFKDGEHIAKSGFFAGYNWVVWTAITFQAMGGVVVALVVNYADNIAKNFATSISIVVSFLASVFFFDFQITGAYVIGTIVVLGATYLYNTQPAEKGGRPPQIDVTDYEKGDRGQGLPLLSDESARRSRNS